MPPEPITILFVAGDPSGDLHAAHLISAIKRLSPTVHAAAVGGPLMRAACDEFIEDLAGRGVTGFWEPILKIGFLLELAGRLRAFLKGRRPAAVVCVDYYGFNRRVLSLAAAAGVPAFYYVSPQVWASRPGRVGVLKRLVRKMLVIFPFEEKLYREAGVPCAFVGHPLLDHIPAPQEQGRDAALRVALLPGSRASEVARHLPLMIESYRLLADRFPGSRAFVFAAASLPDAAYAPARAASLEIVRESDYSLRRGMDLALCSSGTATLENALLGIPMVVVYKLSWLTYAIARAIIRVPYISMANILAGRALVPELIQRDANPHAVAQAAAGLCEDTAKRAALRGALLALRETLGGPGASTRAAREILVGVGAAAS